MTKSNNGDDSMKSVKLWFQQQTKGQTECEELLKENKESNNYAIF